ncbi:unnamed protein product [Paramecium octaurelia]|uniref:TLC domain-containing protein n=1 Tax=Paramecium octaurelia TaxID=43137 RepID=A0A8S1XXL4_PAROT|nr:unnamed protein product [Paramecium octaurelia]
MYQWDLVNESSDQLRMFSYCFILWSALFILCYDRIKLNNLSSKRQIDVFNRIVSILHGQFTFWGSLIVILSQTPYQLQEMNSSEMQFVMIVSAGYFAYDVIICTYFDLYDYWLIFHHVISLMAFGESILYKKYGHIIIFGMFITEISNLPMHLRHILGCFGLRQTKIYESIEILYFSLFIIFRGILSPVLLIRTYEDLHAPLLIKISASGLLVYSAYYIIEMIKITQRKIKSYRERKRRNLKMYWFSQNPLLPSQKYVDSIL